MENISKRINRLAGRLLKALVFLIPFFFLPWTSTLSGMDNFNKLNLLLVFAPLLFFLFFFARIRLGDFRFKKTIMDVPILFFLAAVTLAAVFSLDKFASIFGAFSYIFSPFLAVLSLILLYYFVINFFKKGGEIESFVKLFLKIQAIIVFASVIFMFGYWSGFLKIVFISEWFKLAVGSLDDLALFIAVINVLILGLISQKNYFQENFEKEWQRKAIKASLVLSFVILALINYSVAWMCLFLGMVVVIALNHFYLPGASDWKKKAIGFLRDPKMLWLNIILFFSLAILLLNLLTYSSGVIERRQAQKMQLSHGYSHDLAQSVLKKRPFFGYGPENYSYAFSSLRSGEINNSDYWYLRFNHGSSYLIDMIISFGLFGFLGLIGIFGFFVYVAILVLRRMKKEKEPNPLVTALVAVIFALIIAQIFSAINLVLLFIFWLFLAFFMICAEDYLGDLRGKKIFKEINISREEIRRIILIVFVLAVFLWVILLGLSLKFWLADANFKKAINQTAPEKKEMLLKNAIKSNPWRCNYKIALAKHYRDKAISALSRPKKNLETIKVDVNNSINWAREAVKNSPFSVITHETLGSIYRDLGPYLEGDEILSVEAFQQAINLEPTNPVLYSELGKIYLANGLLEEAKKFFQSSLDLRSDNYEAKIGMAKTLAALSQNEEALAILEELKKDHPTADVYYEEGMIYFNLKNYEQAIVKFQQVISLSPLHSNALYGLGLAQEASQEYEAALHYFNKVNQLNPGNKQIEDKIKQIKLKIEE